MMNFDISPNAEKRISKLLKDEENGTYLRVSVIGGGCSGFQYHFDFDASPLSNDDNKLEKSTAIVVVDNVSLEFLKDSVLDYVETLGGSAFEITNPNATSSCGCGNSFSL
jgi:iron-sulfur cluster insertion protein